MNQSSPTYTAAVTGATGFLGRVLCRKLLEQGVAVRALYRNPENRSCLDGLDLRTIRADVTNPADLKTAFEGVDVVFHIAALFRQQGVPDGMFWDVNVEGTRNVLDMAKAAGVRKVVHCSTVGVHSHIPAPPADEMEQYRPADIYQHTKCEGEKLALAYFRDGRIDGCVIRPAMIWGPGDRRTLKLYRGIARRQLPIIGSGKIHLHWVLVDDVAKGLILAANAGNNTGEIYIIAGREPVSIERLFRRIADQLDTSPIPFKIPAKPVQMVGEMVEKVCRPLGVEPPIYRRRVDFFTKTRAFDWSKAKSELGYAPGQSLNDEIRTIVRSYRSLNWL